MEVNMDVCVCTIAVCK